MQRGIVAILLYLVVIILSIILGSQGEIIMGLFYSIFAGILFFVAFFLINLEVKNKPSVHFLVDPNSIEHIVMPIFFLIYLFIGNIIWLFSPEIGTFIISQNYTYVAVALPLCSFSLGGIFSYLRFRTSTDETNNE